ncbi:Gfo/Idh/MocA family protein [Haladaptatus sp. NG-SE-30]
MTLRVGIIGTGGLGTHIGTQFRHTPNATLIALADISEEGRNRAGETLDVSEQSRYATPEAMLKGERLDAVAIVTPHALHFEHVIAALDHDLHVLCEKPLVVDLDQARDLVHRDAERDEVLMVGYQRHFDPAFVRARERIRETDDPTFIGAEITEEWLQPNLGTWRVDPSLSGGGFLYDTGNHLIDVVLWTTGLTPTTVDADMDFHTERTDIRANLTVDFENGATAHVSMHGDVPRVRERLAVWDDDGGVLVEGREWRDRSLRLIHGDGGEYSPSIKAFDSYYERPPTKAEAFVAAVEGDAPVPATVRDALRATAVTEAAYESAQTGERVAVALSEE